MLRDRIIEFLVELHRCRGADEWITIEELAQKLEAPIADVMYETGALSERRCIEKTGARAKSQIRVTEKGRQY